MAGGASARPAGARASVCVQAAGGMRPRTSGVCWVEQSGGFHVTFHPGIGSQIPGWYVS